MLEAILGAIGVLLGLKDSISSKSKADRENISIYLLEVSRCIKGIASSARGQDKRDLMFYCGELDIFINRIPPAVRDHIGVEQFGNYKQKLAVAKRMPLAIIFGYELMNERAVNELMRTAGELHALAHIFEPS
jgi:hypothetical protein